MRLEELTHDGGAKGIADGVRTFRIDLAKTLELLKFPAEVWEWHDLLGHTLLLTQAHAKLHDNDLADTPYKQFLVRAIQCDIGTIGAIYTLLRFEWVHQAAAHVRLLCESTITLRYIAGDLANRLQQFLDYQHIEAYEIAVSIVEQERDKAKPVHVQRLQDALDGLREDYERVKPRYTFTDRRQRSRAYTNWCNINLRKQAEDCGASFVRLYRLVPHEKSDVLGNWLARHAFQPLRVFECFHLSTDSLVLSLLAKDTVLNPKDDGVAVWFRRFDTNNFASINPYPGLSSDLLRL